jgi:hypothetical protein
VLVAGEGIQLTTNAVSDSITFDVTYLKGSVFSDTSTLVVNGATGTVVGAVATSSLRTSEPQIRLGLRAGEIAQAENTIAVGRDAGYTTQGIGAISVGTNAGQNNQGSYAVAVGTGCGLGSQGNNAVAVGIGAGQTNQGTSAVAIGDVAGYNGQGANAVAIGKAAGATSQSANSIVINASGIALNGAAAGFYVNPIREVTGPQVVYYDPTSKEVTWGPVPAGGISGGGSSNYEFSVAGDDSSMRTIFSGETLRFAGAGGITTATDGEGKVTITGPTLATVATSGSYNDLSNRPTFPSLGNITLVGTTIDSSDSSGIVFTPAVSFNSDITVENELTVRNSATVSGTLTVNNLNITGVITSQGSGTPEIFSDNEVLLTAGTRVEISSSPLKMASFTTDQRNLLAAETGDVIYNTTLNKFQGYVNGSWVDFH